MTLSGDLAAQVERTAIALRLTYDARRANRKWAMDAERKAGRQRAIKQSRCPHRPPKWAVDAVQQERQACRALRKLSAKEWCQRLRQIKGAEHNHVASIIWWDYFAPRVSSERWDELDRSIDSVLHYATEEKLFFRLLELGFTPYSAFKRLFPSFLHKIYNGGA